MAVISSTITAHVYTEIKDNFFFISSMENCFGDEKVIFQDDNASCHRVREIKIFLQERQINNMASEQSGSKSS